jgi:hypothetical protein
MVKLSFAFQLRQLWLLAAGWLLPCENCGARPTTLESRRTAYAWNGIGKDPNAPIRLCAECATEHHEYWNDMWAEYYSGRL